MLTALIIHTTHPVQADITKEVFEEITGNPKHPFHQLAVHEHVEGQDVYYIKYNEYIKFSPGMGKNQIIKFLHQ